jgi:basic membrane protein A
MIKKNFGKTLVGAVTTSLLLSVVVSVGSPASAASKPIIGIAYDLGGRSQPGFNQLAYLGAQPYAKAHPGVTIKELQASLADTDSTRAERLRILAKAGANPIVVVGFLYSGALAKVAKEYPKVKFGIIDDSSVIAPNVEDILFKEEQGSFLVGVAAALKSKTGNVGFIGGVKTPGIQKFEAGFIAGAKAVNASVKTQSAYISSPPDFSGFNDPAKGKEAALGMFQNGADVVYSAAGGSGAGAHQAAFEQSKMSIGVDADEALFPSNAKVKGVIITSMMKRVDTGAFSFVSDALSGKFVSGVHTFELSNKGVGYSTTGNHLTAAMIATIEGFAKKIISGTIVVPTVPPNA